MLFWIFVIILVAGTIWLSFDPIYYDFPCFLVALGLVGVAVSIIIFAVAHIGIDARLAERHTYREGLVYQYENNIYENDNDLGKRELIVDILEWNTQLAYKQKMQDNFWVGVYVPDIWDAFEPIELEKGE